MLIFTAITRLIISRFAGEDSTQSSTMLFLSLLCCFTYIAIIFKVHTCTPKTHTEPWYVSAPMYGFSKEIKCFLIICPRHSLKSEEIFSEFV